MTSSYTKTAIILHWLIALSIIALLIMGLLMSEDDLLPAGIRFATFQIHKSLGLTVLVLSTLRLVWRLMHKAPPYPDHMKPWEKFAASATHVILYVLMFALPLTGWALVSTSPRDIPTIWFGLFQWPHLPIFEGVENRGDISHDFGEVHESLAWIAIILIAGHVGAALKHYIIDRDDVLTRMIPVLKPLKK